MKTLNEISMQELSAAEEDYDACNNIQGFVGLYNALVISAYIAFCGLFAFALFKLW